MVFYFLSGSAKTYSAFPVAARPVIATGTAGPRRKLHVLTAYGILSNSIDRMRLKKKSQLENKARYWAARLMESVRQVLARYPEADPDNVRHTLILLEYPPIERLRRSLIRGRSLAQRK